MGPDLAFKILVGLLGLNLGKASTLYKHSDRLLISPPSIPCELTAKT